MPATSTRNIPYSKLNSRFIPSDLLSHCKACLEQTQELSGCARHVVLLGAEQKPQKLKLGTALTMMPHRSCLIKGATSPRNTPYLMQHSSCIFLSFLSGNSNIRHVESPDNQFCVIYLPYPCINVFGFIRFCCF